jgi:shikimate dehydrogenase
MDSSLPRRVGLLGWPVAHSHSPAMHKAAFKELGLHWDYLLLPVRPEHVSDAVHGIRGFGLEGANVTVPHKQAVMESLDEVTEEARAIGAVNTILNQEGRLIGYNTDAVGFLRALREVGFDPRGCRAVLLGAGGAARAVLYTLLAARAEVVLVNRGLQRGRQLADDFQPLFQARVPVLPLAYSYALQEALNSADLLVNATNMGMHPQGEASPLPDAVAFHKALTVYDLVYQPLHTRLLSDARAAGARGIDGLGMLVHQGAAAFTLWTGEVAPLEVMRAAASSSAKES